MLTDVTDVIVTHVQVCVCVRERERERERVCVCVLACVCECVQAACMDVFMKVHAWLQRGGKN